jgi:hypothetical protein
MSKRVALALAFALAAFGVLMFLSRSVAVRGAGYGNPALSFPERPMLQGSESEPNDDISQANPIDIPGTVRGVITPTSDVDWFRLDLLTIDVGREFEATLEELIQNADYRLELRLYSSDGTRLVSEDGSTSSTISWTATETTYYLRASAIEMPAENPPGQEYRLTLDWLPPPPTDTPTAAPTATAEPWDDYEINDYISGDWATQGGPYQIAVGVKYTGLNFVPASGKGIPAGGVPNNDFFSFQANAGSRYRITTEVQGGADTEMWLYSPDDDADDIAYNNDISATDRGSRIERVLNQTGRYRILVRDFLKNDPPVTVHTYSVLVELVSPQATTEVTPEPTSTRIPGSPDAFEPNYDFDRASLIGLGVTYGNLNFVPWTGQGVDNDFYKLWVIGGKLYTCETLELGDATNTNMILYSCPSSECGFAGNDDVQPFDANDPYRSRITFFSSYTGYLYVLLGQVGTDRILPREWASLSYKLRCYIEQPGTATPTPTSPYVPPPPTAVPQETAAAAPTRVVIVIIPMTTPPPPPPSVPVSTPTPQLFVINLTLYYDRNGNGQMESDEGIVDVLARAYDAITGELLAVDYTNEMGQLRFNVPNTRPVRLSVPYFGFDQIVTATNSNIQIRIAPQP